MEPAGLAVGIIGLAGLFSSCLEVVDKVSAYKNFEKDYSRLGTQFAATKLRLKRWGQDVGLGQDKTLAGKHHAALDDPETIEMVQELLLCIADISEADGDHAVASKRRMEEQDESRTRPTSVLTFRRKNKKSSTKATPSRLGWVLTKKAGQEQEVQNFQELVQQLYNLVPPTTHQSTIAGNKSYIAAENLNYMNSVLVMQMQKRPIQDKASTRWELTSWLQGDYIPSERYETAIEKRLNGTCDWFLQRPIFQQWLASSDAEVLWVNGPPGFGKTVLCARVIQHLCSTIQTPVVYFFLSSSAARHADPFMSIRSWISDIIRVHDGAFEVVHRGWGSRRYASATRADISRLLREVLLIAQGCTLILDGLDECSEVSSEFESGHSIQAFLKALEQAVEGTSAKVFIMSRNDNRIRSALTRFMEYQITSVDVRDDTERFSRNIVDRKLYKKKAEIRGDVSRMLSDRCAGQFLWLEIQRNSLKNAMNLKQLRRTIEETPEQLDNLYERDCRAIDRLGTAERTRALSILRLVIFALRPLTVAEISEAVLLDDDSEDEGFPVDDLPDMIDDEYINEYISSLCGSLIEVARDVEGGSIHQRTVRLTHFTVKEYLIRNNPFKDGFIHTNGRLSNEAAGNLILARLCLRYINFPLVWDDNPQQDEVAVGYFRNYAASSWYTHVASSAHDESRTVHLIQKLFEADNPVWDSWRTWYDLNEGLFSQDEIAREKQPPGPVYYAIQVGLTEIALSMIKEGKYNVQGEGTLERTALGAVCAKGNPKVTEALLDMDVDVSHRTAYGSTPIHVSAKRGHLDVLRLLLLKSSTDINTPNHDGETPLTSAAENGHTDVVRLLLDSGADIETRTKDQLTPLELASVGDHVEIVEILLAHGAQLETTSVDGWSPLGIAADSGSAKVVKLLLDKGANYKTQNGDGMAPIHLASFNGYPGIVRMLLEAGDNVNAINRNGLTSLLLASSSSSIETMELLVSRGAGVECLDDTGWTPLHWAARRGRVKAAKLLIANGATLEPLTNWGWTPLNLAASYGHVNMVKLLIDKGADIQTTTKDGMTPLHIASERGHTMLVKLLAGIGVDLDTSNEEGSTPLISASAYGHAGIVKILLEEGADIKKVDSTGWTALHMACNRGHSEVVRVLLQDPNVQVNVLEPGARTCLFLCSRAGFDEVVRILIEDGRCSLSCKDWYDSTPLHVAVRNNRIEVMGSLLAEDGALTTQRDGFGKTLLWWARRAGTPAVEALQDGAKRAGIELEDDPDLPGTPFQPLDTSTGWCDACTRNISKDSVYCCKICHGGNFHLCAECVTNGVKCHEEDHVLIEWGLR